MCNRFDKEKKKFYDGLFGDSVIIGVFPKYHPFILFFMKIIKSITSYVVFFVKTKVFKEEAK